MGQRMHGSWDAFLASPADFAGADNIIINLAKERGPGIKIIERTPWSLIITSFINNYCFVTSLFFADVGSNNSGYYELSAVLTHQGRSSSSGHYLAWIRRKGGNSIHCLLRMRDPHSWTFLLAPVSLGSFSDDEGSENVTAKMNSVRVFFKRRRNNSNSL